MQPENGGDKITVRSGNTETKNGNTETNNGNIETKNGNIETRSEKDKNGTKTGVSCSCAQSLLHHSTRYIEPPGTVHILPLYTTI